MKSETSMFVSCGKFEVREHANFLGSVTPVTILFLYENHSNGLSCSFCFVTPVSTKSENLRNSVHFEDKKKN